MDFTKNKSLIIISVSFLLFVVIMIIALYFYNTSSNNYNSIDNQIDQIIYKYKEQGIELNYSDLSVVDQEDSGEEIILLENKEKIEAYKQTLNERIKIIYSNTTGVDKKYLEQETQENKTSSISIDIDDIITEVNIDLNEIKVYLEKASEYNKNNFQQNYVELLLNQRQTGNPDKDTDFVIQPSLLQKASYLDYQYRLNAHSFLNIQYPNRVVLDDYKYFNPYVYSFYSDTLFNNILNNKIYDENIYANNVISVEEYSEKYILNTNNNEKEYISIVKLNTINRSIILGIENGKFILLDILNN